MQSTGPQKQITLYHYWRSSCSWRVRWALLHKGVKYDEHTVNLLLNEQNSAEYRQENPGGYVPALKIEGDTYGESLAMMEWIEETHPNKPLLPTSALDRMRVRQMCLMIVSGTQPLQNLSVMRHHSSDAATQAQWARHWIEDGLSKFEKLVSQYAGTFCFGGALTLADLCLVPQMYNARRFNIDVSRFAILSTIEKHCLRLVECERAAPHNQKQ